MKLTDEQLAEWEVAASQGKYRFSIDLADLFVQAVPALIAELREARSLVVALAPDALHEAEERKQILKDSDELWRGRMQDAETAHKAEVAELEAKLAEAEKDAQRYRWLTDDHSNWTTRQACRDILCWMPVMSYSVASAAIDAAIAAQEKP